jgi:hypothetical protein
MRIINSIKYIVIVVLATICFGCVGSNNSSSVDNQDVVMDGVTITATEDSILDVVIGKEKLITILLNNNSSDTLYNLKPNQLDNQSFSWNNVNDLSACGQQLNSGGQCKLTLIYNPNNIEQGEISIGANYTLSVDGGNIFNFKPLKIKYSSTEEKALSVEFYNQDGDKKDPKFSIYDGSETKQLNVVITNNAQMLEFKQIEFNGLPKFFSIANNNCVGVLLGSQSCSFDLIYTPENIEKNDFSLSINAVDSNDKNVEIDQDVLYENQFSNEIVIIDTKELKDSLKNIQTSGNVTATVKFINNSNLRLNNIAPICQVTTVIDDPKCSITKNDCPETGLTAKQSCDITISYTAPSQWHAQDSFAIFSDSIRYNDNDSIKTISARNKIIVHKN